MGSGKSRAAQAYVERGYERLNRDTEAFESFRAYRRLPMALRADEAERHLRSIVARREQGSEPTRRPRRVLVPLTKAGVKCIRDCVQPSSCRPRLKTDWRLCASVCALVPEQRWNLVTVSVMEFIRRPNVWPTAKLPARRRARAGRVRALRQLGERDRNGLYQGHYLMVAANLIAAATPCSRATLLTRLRPVACNARMLPRYLPWSLRTAITLGLRLSLRPLRPAGAACAGCALARALGETVAPAKADETAA